MSLICGTDGAAHPLRYTVTVTVTEFQSGRPAIIRKVKRKMIKMSKYFTKVDTVTIEDGHSGLRRDMMNPGDVEIHDHTA